MTPLTLHLKEQYWSAIRAGSKTEEYRLRLPYWEKRLRGKTFSEVVLLLGYPKAGDKSRILRRKWKGFREIEIQADLFGPDKVPVFAIDVSEPVACDDILAKLKEGR